MPGTIFPFATPVTQTSGWSAFEMPGEPVVRNDIPPFGGEFDQEHRRVDPCFMTGKGCVYTEVIDQTIKERKLRVDKDGKRDYLGFSVMPFRKNLDTFFKNCLVPYFAGAYGGKVSLQRADEVRRPGIIICEGICKRIQESDFVTVDVSVPNANVFYELGLAYGMGHKIVVIHHDRARFATGMTDDLRGMECNPLSYHDLDPISQPNFDRNDSVWRNKDINSGLEKASPKMLFYEHHLKADTPIPDVPEDDQTDIQLDFVTHVRSAVGLAIEKLATDLKEDEEAEPATRTYVDIIRGFKKVEPVKTDSQFKEIKDQVESAYCMIIRTGFKECHPMAYFWLGYGHARGKHVIPVTVIDDRDARVDDLAFDIRAQRHMIFIKNAPDRFEQELNASLRQMILADFSEWSRRRFWDRLLGKRGEVSIFTGALHVEDFGREMIGDWDLRAASELTSYFALQQYRATIENPVYTPEYWSRDPAKKASKPPEYVDTLKEMMTDKNCILIASPDVNPLTEIALGMAYGAPANQLFAEGKRNITNYPDAMVVFKEKPRTAKQGAKRFFYKEESTGPDPDPDPDKPRKSRRGFKSAQLIDGELLETFESQLDKEVDQYGVFGHLVILPNPVRTKESSGDRYIIVLNGVSGPATFALTHVLTGGVTKEFVSYGDAFNPKAESENILGKILASVSSRGFNSVDCIINVKVGRSRNNEERLAVNTSDWRRILSWELNESARRQQPIRIMP